MAKTPAPVAAPAARVIAGIILSRGPAPAESKRVGSAAKTAVAEAIEGLLPPENGEYDQFFQGVDVPATITDPTERAKASKEAQRKLTNLLTGRARRVKLADPTKNFAIRSVTEEVNGVLVDGARVFRVEPEPADPMTPEAAAAA